MFEKRDIYYIMISISWIFVGNKIFLMITVSSFLHVAVNSIVQADISDKTAIAFYLEKGNAIKNVDNSLLHY